MNKDNKLNISVIGGPGKPHTSGDNSSTISSTGGTGGMGFTGATGASGFGGGLGREINSIMDEEESVDDFSRKVAGIGLYGSTGGEGQHGPLDKVPMNSSSLAAMGKLFSDKINKMDSIDAILQDFNTCQTKLELLLQKTNAVNAYYAFMQGTRLLKLQRIRGNKKDWIQWIKKELPTLGKRTREKYMSLASIPMVETHLEYGVERLAEFGSFYASKSDTEQNEMAPDPFSWYMKKFNFRIDSSYDERKEHVNGALEVSKLERLGMEFPLDVMLSFLRKHDALTGDERKHLIKLYKQDPQKPVDLLNRIIAKELERKNLIAGTNPPPAEENSDASNDQNTPDSGAGEATAVTGPNIEKQVFTLCKSLESATTPEGIKLDSSIDRHVLMRLKSFIDQLLEMNQDTQSAQDAAA
ncbi:MAG: hypothetical protein HY795_09860 [Desulfovibrio sp.]|nr:hypothetical protein [Desulfovibrio sp.]MBI4959608.1 hypothetical protein [Desulfovibrio sp.]